MKSETSTAAPAGTALATSVAITAARNAQRRFVSRVNMELLLITQRDHDDEHCTADRPTHADRVGVGVPEVVQNVVDEQRDEQSEAACDELSRVRRGSRCLMRLVRQQRR